MKKKDNRKKDNSKSFTGIVKTSIDNLYTKGRAPLTIMVTPHNESKIVHFRVSLFLLWSLAFITILLIASIIIFSTGYASKSSMLSEKNIQTEQLQGALADISIEVNKTDHYGKIWGEAIKSASGGISSSNENREAIAPSGDINIVTSRVATSQSSSADVEKLAKIRGMMEESIPKLKELSDKMGSQKRLLSEMPTQWPAQDGGGKQIGFLSQLFGPTRDPFTGEWQFHTGADIAFGFGVPIVASANGTVVKTDYNAGGYGNYIIIRHSYGFFTRYAHMQRYNVVPGQVVKQGQILGYMGSTGRSTGPHVHFEVMIGTEVVDPMRYLSINNQAYSRYIRDDGNKQ